MRVESSGASARSPSGVAAWSLPVRSSARSAGRRASQASPRGSRARHWVSASRARWVGGAGSTSERAASASRWESSLRPPRWPRPSTSRLRRRGARPSAPSAAGASRSTPSSRIVSALASPPRSLAAASESPVAPIVTPRTERSDDSQATSPAPIPRESWRRTASTSSASPPGTRLPAGVWSGTDRSRRRGRRRARRATSSAESGWWGWTHSCPSSSTRSSQEPGSGGRSCAVAVAHRTRTSPDPSHLQFMPTSPPARTHGV